MGCKRKGGTGGGAIVLGLSSGNGGVALTALERASVEAEVVGRNEKFNFNVLR